MRTRSMIPTPTLPDLQERVPYPLRSDLEQAAEPYSCRGCGERNTYIGVRQELPVKGGGTKAALFCVVCVADGTAVGVVRG